MHTDRDGFEPRSWKTLATCHGTCWLSLMHFGVFATPSPHVLVRAQGVLIVLSWVQVLALEGDTRSYRMDNRYCIVFKNVWLAGHSVSRDRDRDMKGFRDSGEARACPGRFWMRRAEVRKRSEEFRCFQRRRICENVGSLSWTIWAVVAVDRRRLHHSCRRCAAVCSQRQSPQVLVWAPKGSLVLSRVAAIAC